MIGDFHHVGVACRSIETEEKIYAGLGFVREGDIFEDPIQRIRGLFLTKGEYRLELLEPLDEESPVQGFIGKGISLYHQAFMVSDLAVASEFLRSLGAFKISGPSPAIAFDMRPVSFFMMKNRQLIELIQE